MIHCPPEQTLERLVAGELEPDDTSRIDLHVESCATCREWLEAAMADEGLLANLQALDPVPGAEPTPERIAGYRILEEIGAGGMGVVYSAEQESPRRRVALKVVRPGFATGRALRRFEHEAAALGRLQHPGIAQIFEAGTFGTGAGPRPYFAMEFVDGRPLGEYADEHQMSLEGRVELFTQVGDAVQHAHEKGVVHRDLKPANILVDRAGRATILDFGVARLSEDGAEARDRTIAGQLVGTLAYMSPEQVCGDPDLVDTRSDVHALGVILYELLTGRLPYDLSRKSTAAAIRVLAESDPVPAAQRDRRLRGDLATILDKALAKEPGRRFGTAAEFTAELRRFLRYEPIHSRPPSAAYQLRKFARRHWGLVLGVAAVFLVLVAGVATSLVLWQTAEDAARRALREASEAEAAREFMQEVLALASPRQRSTGREPTIHEALNIALERIDELESKPWVEASVRHTLGRVLGDLRRFDEAKQQFEKSLACYREVYGPHHAKVAYVLASKSTMLFRAGEHGPARVAAEEALALRDTLTRESHRQILGTALLNVGKASFLSGDYEGADRLVRASIDNYLAAEGPKSVNAAITRGVLAAAQGKLGHIETAEQLYREALRGQRAVLGNEHPVLIAPLGNFATFLEEEGRWADAERFRRKALELSRTHDAEGPLRTVLCEMNLGQCLCHLGRSDEGLPLIRGSLAKLEKRPPKRRHLARCLVILAEGIRLAGRAEESLIPLGRARELLKERGAKDSVSIRAELARCAALIDLARKTEAETLLGDVAARLADAGPACAYLKKEATTLRARLKEEVR